MKLSINADALIKEKGGVSEMARYLTDRKFPVTRQGVSKWGRERMIPMRAWLRINFIEGGNLDLNKYIVVEK